MGPDSYTSGINAGPVWSPQQTSGALAGLATRFRQPMQFKSPFMSSAAQHSLGRRYGNQMQAAGFQAQSDSDRTMAAANANQLLKSQNARAQSGIQGGNLLQQLHEDDFRNSFPLQSGILNLLMSQV